MVGGNGEWLLNRYRVSFWDDAKVLELVMIFQNLLNILKTPEFYTLKWLKCRISYYVNFTSKKKAALER